MKKRTKIIIILIIFIIILYFLIVGYIAWKDGKNRQAIQNFCDFKMLDFNVSNPINHLNNDYDSSIEKLKNMSNLGK
jgi:flagellar basal body-associated protein FliL